MKRTSKRTSKKSNQKQKVVKKSKEKTIDINKQILNIGSGEGTSVRDVAEKVLALTGKKADILYTPRNNTGVSLMTADISLAKKKLGYKSRVSLEKGLEKTLVQDPRFQPKK